MTRFEIRDIRQKYSLWRGFRDEIVITAMTLSLLVLGSFLLTERIMPKTQKVADAMPSDVLMESSPTTLGLEDNVEGEPLAESTNAIDTETIEGAVVHSTVPYGDDGDYDFSGYSISFRDPRIEFDIETNSKRKLIVNVWIKNKNVTEGLTTRLTASIIKDGNVIVPSAVMYVASPKRIRVGEETSFAATLSLIEGTDVRELKYVPGNDVVEASHFLYP